eukprot:c19026_g1_i2.p1 GENE.c19026_g1_i2~~c19026_g1_i2.p1  ORF type:complete len:535 (+),score=158.04 c19026_g1_i2:213-1817(+)
MEQLLLYKTGSNFFHRTTQTTVADSNENSQNDEQPIISNPVENSNLPQSPSFNDFIFIREYPSQPRIPTYYSRDTMVDYRPMMTGISRCEEKCDTRHGYSLVDKIKSSKINLCSKNEETVAEFYGFKNFCLPELYYSTFRNLTVDLHFIQESAEMKNCSMEGPSHDPRFKSITNHLHCQCDQPFPQSVTTYKMLYLFPLEQNNIWRCSTATTQEPRVENQTKDLIIDEPVIVVSRKEDHNPFFMISSIFNAWLFSKVKNISFDNFTLVAMDNANVCDFPVTDLFLKLPKKFISMWDYKEKVVLFRDVSFSSSEFNGVLMEGLNEKQWLCDEKSELVYEFRNYVLSRYGLTNIKSEHDDKITVTIISRPKKNNHGRILNRVLRNEDELLISLQTTFENFVVRKVSLEEMKMEEQIRTFQTSDVIIGMHGAGLANIIFAREGTTIIEIFPHMKSRFSFKRISAKAGLRYYEYRQGEDFIQEDKVIPLDEFLCYFSEEERCILERKNFMNSKSMSSIDPQCFLGNERHRCFSLNPFF